MSQTDAACVQRCGWHVCLVFTYHPVELGAFVALRLAPIVLGLSGAELAKILSGSWNHVLEQFHLDASQLLTCDPS